MTALPFLDEILDALGTAERPPVDVTGTGAFPSAFAVTELATSSIAAAGCELALLSGTPGVVVDRRLASWWFLMSVRPIGWQPAPVWDPIAGDYESADGWIRLHTNAAHHRDAVLRVLGCANEKDAVTAATARWIGSELEAAVVDAGGCAAEMRDAAAWRDHPQGLAVNGEPLVATETHAASAGTATQWAPLPGRPLNGLRVLDLTRILAGPVATRFLAGYGADVLRLDPPEWEEPTLAPEVTVGKRCARLDLRTSEGRARFEELLATADVLVHGYRSDALERLGLGAQRRRSIRPGLVDVSLDAYGWSGPWAQRRGFDSLVQMSSGIAHAGMVRAQSNRPTPLPAQALDHATGYLLAAAALNGLRRRSNDGHGTTARLSLARTAALLVDGPAGDLAATIAPPNDDDYDTAIEHTHEGPARRLRPPLVVEGASMHWSSAACALGSAQPHW